MLGDDPYRLSPQSLSDFWNCCWRRNYTALRSALALAAHLRFAVLTLLDHRRLQLHPDQLERRPIGDTSLQANQQLVVWN